METMKWLLKPGGRAVFEFGGFGNTYVCRHPYVVDRSESVFVALFTRSFVGTAETLQKWIPGISRPPNSTPK